MQENLSGARVVRAYAQEPHEMARFESANQEYLRRNRQLIRMFGSLYPGIQFLMGTGSVLVVIVTTMSAPRTAASADSAAVTWMPRAA